MSGLLLSVVQFAAVDFLFGQGAFNVTLSPSLAPDSTLTGSAIITTPATSDEGLLFPVDFIVEVDTDEPLFTTGRISGNHVAWAFDLGTPAIQSGSSRYNGTTDMTANQIANMLAGGTSFEILDDNFTASMSGQMVLVPEPGSLNLLACGLLIFISKTRKLAAIGPN